MDVQFSLFSKQTALIRLSDIAALETQEHGVSVLSIDPGTVLTSMVTSRLTSEDIRGRAPNIQRDFRGMIDADRLSPPESATQLALKLAAGEADSLSGCYISVDDDLADFMSQAQEITLDRQHTLRIRMLSRSAIGSLWAVLKAISATAHRAWLRCSWRYRGFSPHPGNDCT